MSVELKPLKNLCNLRCTYCYQNSMRDAELREKYDVDAMLKTAEAQGANFTLFGGEPLLVPISDLDRMWAFGHEKFQQNGVQTNGVLVNDKHFELFKKYNVHVGFSIDGPGEMNTPRGTVQQAKRSVDNFERCLKEKIPCSLITTLHKYNCKPEHIIWLSHLDDLGLPFVNLHLLENDGADDIVISQSQQIEYLGWLFDATRRFNVLRCDLFNDMIKRVYTGAGGCCVWQGCDPYTTIAVQGIGPHGELHNCGREQKDGVDYIKADSIVPMRDVVLQSTPQELGGCQGCRHWYACHGYCPGTGLRGDWRNRTEHCESLKAVFKWIESKGNISVTVKPNV